MNFTEYKTKIFNEEKEFKVMSKNTGKALYTFPTKEGAEQCIAGLKRKKMFNNDEYTIE